MYQCINITLPKETLELLDRIAPKGDRSHFIDQAVKYYINTEAKKNLREKLKQGAMRRADRNLKITQNWFNITSWDMSITQFKLAWD
jgi:CopG family transcriptional regulator/antitoxin EndoAI